MKTIFKKVREWFAHLMHGTRMWLANYLFCRGKYHVEIFRPGVGVIYDEDVPNGITDEGLNHILGVEFHADTQITTWYIGLVDNASFSAFAAGDVMNSHAGWIEVIAYDESTRVAWGPDASATRSISNTSAATFTINASKTLKGIFVTSGSAKSGTAGVLWSTAAFASTVAVIDNDVVKVTYTVSG
jgi:hypothetical protein